MSSGETVVGITAMSGNLSLQRDLLVVERNEAGIQRKELRGLHDEAVSLFSKIFKCKDRVQKRALKRQLGGP